MGKFDRCYLCDYNEVEGSLFANVSPGDHGMVRWNQNLEEFVCTACENYIIDNCNLYEFGENDKECQNTTSPAPAGKVQTPLQSSTTEEAIATQESAEEGTNQEV